MPFLPCYFIVHGEQWRWLLMSVNKVDAVNMVFTWLIIISWPITWKYNIMQSHPAGMDEKYYDIIHHSDLAWALTLKQLCYFFSKYNFII